MYHTPLSGLLIYALRHNFQAYMIRLHLWGIGTGYDSFAKFCDALQKRRRQSIRRRSRLAMQVSIALAQEACLFLSEGQ